MRSVAQAESSIQILVQEDAATSQRAAPLHERDLQGEILKADGVVAIHRAFKLQRQNLLQIALVTGHKGAAALGRRDLEAAIELGGA
ncbi:MAG TPA: hypothetical protein VMU26_18960 [Candidatus Polarisedimenticolia bacterium]|nr:hypothetical protein [Candidatus Polarisedimenticolia bacterium]